MEYNGFFFVLVILFYVENPGTKGHFLISPSKGFTQYETHVQDIITKSLKALKQIKFCSNRSHIVLLR